MADAAAVLADVGDPPCASCRLRQVCAAERISCHDFAFWTTTGRLRPENPDHPRRPSRKQYVALYGPMKEHE